MVAFFFIVTLQTEVSTCFWSYISIVVTEWRCVL